MASYPLPPWLSPGAAQGWGDLAATGAQLEMRRAQIQQSGVNASMEAQARQQELAARAQAQQEQLAKENQQEQQKIAIDQAYKEAQVGLHAQDLDLADKEFQAKTKQASDRFAATQAFQKAMLPVDQGGEGLTPQKAALKYIAPFMTGDEIGRMAVAPAGSFTPGAPINIPGRTDKQYAQTSPNHFQIIDAPATATNAPVAQPVTGDDGTIGYWVQPPGGGKPHWQVAQKTSGLEAAMEAYRKSKGEAAPKDKNERKAEGGYKIGALYKGGLRYLGGDPKDESSWEKVKQ